MTYNKVYIKSSREAKVLKKMTDLFSIYFAMEGLAVQAQLGSHKPGSAVW